MACFMQKIVALPTLVLESEDEEEELDENNLSFGPSDFFASPFVEGDDDEEKKAEVAVKETPKELVIINEKKSSPPPPSPPPKKSLPPPLPPPKEELPQVVDPYSSPPAKRLRPTRTSARNEAKKNATMTEEAKRKEEIMAVRNLQARRRAATMTQRIKDIEAIPESERTKEEKEQLELFIARRERKNTRSKDRLLEKKQKMARIEAKPESERTREEREYLRKTLEARARKNQADRDRRARIKREQEAMGLK